MRGRDMSKREFYSLFIICISIFNTLCGESNFHIVPRQCAKKSITSPKILMVVSEFPSVSETFVIDHIAGLIDRGFDVTIYASNKTVSHSIIHPEVKTYNLMSKVIHKVSRSILEEFNIIMAQFGNLGAKCARWKKKYGLNCKLVTCFRGFDVTKMMILNPTIYNELFQVGDLFLPVSNFFKEKLIQAGCPAAKISVQHSAIDCKKFSYQERTAPVDGIIKIVSTSRLVEKKGIEYAIRALASLVKQFSFHYTIIGDGPLESHLRTVAHNCGTDKHITFLGACDSEQVKKVLEESHIFLLPSVTAASGDQEGIPHAMQEAMALGMPVISTLHSGIPELVEHNRSGLLVPERNVQALQEALQTLFAAPSSWGLMGKIGRTTIEQSFNNIKENDKIAAMLHKLLPQQKIIHQKYQKFFI